MSISDNIVKSISTLDRDTMDIEKITKELCAQICQDTGIETSNVLEEAVSSILTKYKNKEINNDDILEYLKKIYNDSIAYSTNESNNVTSSNQASSQNSGNSGNNKTSKENNSTVNGKKNSNSYNNQTSNSNSGNSGNDQASKENNFDVSSQTNPNNNQTSNTNMENSDDNTNNYPGVNDINRQSQSVLSSVLGIGSVLDTYNAGNNREKNSGKPIRYNESMISDCIAKLQKCSSIPENALTEITKVVNSDNYYGSNTSGIGVVQNIINIGNGFQSYLGNVRSIYDTAIDTLQQFVSSLNMGNNFQDIFLNGLGGVNPINNKTDFHNESIGNILASLSMINQFDPSIKNLPYGNGSMLVSGGCRFNSTLNSLIALFGINDTRELLDIARKKGTDYIFQYLAGSKEKNSGMTVLNSIMENPNNSIVYVSGGFNNFMEEIKNINPNKAENTYVLGAKCINWNDNKGELIELVTNSPKGTNITVSGPCATTGAFGPSTVGHYMSLLFNTDEFVEKKQFYILDSWQRQSSDSDTRKYQYNFYSHPNQFENFNSNYSVEEVTPGVLRVTKKGNQEITTKDLELLGFRGSGFELCANVPGNQV